MQRVADGFVYSASDLHNDLECRRLTWLETQLASGQRIRPERDAAVDLIADKGDAHEARYLEKQRTAHGDRIVIFNERPPMDRAAMTAADARTLAVMASGVPVIYQATFYDGEFIGRADFLRRVEVPSAKWAWSYEIVDTKLALKPKAHFLLQLCNYSEHLTRLQGTAPLYGHLVLGSGLEAHFRIADYAAYYRHQKAQFLARAGHVADAYPTQVGHCAICRWTDTCEEQRETDDYLGIVAGIRGDQVERLMRDGITTIAALGAAGDDRRPRGMTETSFAKLRAQAALQDKQRRALAANVAGEQTYFFELLESEAKQGFEQLPPPAPGDVYFDMEGDPLYTSERGLEYLFGVHLLDAGYRAFWARDLTEERAAFEAFMDFIVERRRRFPDMHVYHYAPYETVALRRLMGVYASREAELDTLLRGDVFIDLYAVVRQSVRISQPSYSIKKLEPFYGFGRATEVKRGDDSIVQFETWIGNGDQKILDDIEQYNNDDCRSTWLLHQWLLERRAELERAAGRELPWRTPPEEREPEEPDPADGLAQRLLTGLPAILSRADLHDADDDTRTRWLLGHLLKYHRREAKPTWWKMFDRFDNADRMAEFDHEAIGDLTLCAEIAPFKAKPRDQKYVHTYAFPDQQYNLRGDVHCPHTQQKAADVIRIDHDANRIELKLMPKIVPNELRAIVPGGPIRTEAQQAALARIATSYEAGDLRERFPAIYDILVRATPRIRGKAPGAVLQPPLITGEAIAELVAALDRSYLFIQGPPGSGKSTTGGRAIAALIAAGLRIGIVSSGYAAIGNLLDKVEEAAAERGLTFTGLHKHSGDEKAYTSKLAAPMVTSVPKNDAFTTIDHQLAAGTPWLFAREEMVQRYDVLFVDESGQLSLGDAIACAGAAKSVVFLGDPLQLAQVSQGSHPLGTGPSVLEHLLGDDHTVAADRGVFLDISYRMHPEICAFISRTVYDDRLRAAPFSANNAVASPGISGSGLRFLAVDHTGNSRESAQEADRIAAEIALLLMGTVTLPNQPPRSMTADDILVVTPYNAQRTRIARTLSARGIDGVRVGTVDKFQGQEAAIVFYSMATSSSDELPRDMGFLFEKNRFNVAISRAQCLSIVVCSPQLLEVRCKTPEEMMLASLLCTYVESAVRVDQLAHA